jgi:anaerobic selenocysteine-containing dehydrogenase
VLTERRGGAAPVSPLLSKLYQEAELRLGPNRAALNPDDARAAGLAEGERASLQTAIGRCDIAVAFDASLPRGVVEAAARPGILDVCAPGARAQVVRL